MAITIPIISSFDDAGIKKAAREFKKAEGWLGKTGAVMKGLDPVANNAGLALVGFGTLGVKAASDQEQAFGALESIFGSSADEMKKWAKSGATIGTTAADAAQSAATLGAGFTNLGMSQADAAKTAQTLIERGSDMAATFGGSATDAIASISAALRGETDPVERYGVAIRAADVEAHALSMGLVKATGDTNKIAAAQVAQEKAQRAVTEATKKFGPDSLQAREATAKLGLAQDALAKATEGTVPELTAAQKQAATLDLILQQTSSSSGAAARELDTVAGSTAQAKADMQDAAAAIWDEMAPAVADVAGKLAEMARWMGENEGKVRLVIGAVAGMTAAIKLANIAMGIHETVSSVINILNGKRSGSSRAAAKATDIDTAALGRNTTAKGLNAAADGRATGGLGRKTKAAKAAGAASKAAGAADDVAAAGAKKLARETGEVAARKGAMKVASVAAKTAPKAVPFVGTAVMAYDLADAIGVTDKVEKAFAETSTKTATKTRDLAKAGQETGTTMGYYGKGAATTAGQVQSLGLQSGYGATATTTLGTKASTAKTSVEGLGSKASTAKTSVEGLGSKAGTTATAVGTLGTKSGTAKTPVEGLGSKASAAKTSVDGLGSKAATAKTNVEGLGAKSGPAATAIDKAKTAAYKASLEFGPMSDEAKAAKKEVADLQAAAGKPGMGTLSSKASTAKTNVSGLKSASDSADGPVGNLGSKARDASAPIGALADASYRAAQNAWAVKAAADAAYGSLGALAQRMRNQGAGGAWGSSPTGRSGRAAGTTIVQVNGALDPDAVGRQVGRILGARASRSGQAVAVPAW